MNLVRHTHSRLSFAVQAEKSPSFQLVAMLMLVVLVCSRASSTHARERFVSDYAVGSGAETTEDDAGGITVLGTEIESGFVGPPNQHARSQFFANEEPACREFMYPRQYCEQDATWQVMPAGLLYHSYLGGVKEPRFNAIWLTDQNGRLFWETQLGGRVGILRKGTKDPIFPQGWQLDLEGGAQTRIMLEENSDVEATDFRVGFLSTTRHGLWSTKCGYYHISSHVGDEFLEKNIGFNRLNYVRDAVVVGLSRDVLIGDRPDARVYGEFGYAVNHEEGSPLEFQTGIDYSPLIFNGLRGSPFMAVNGQFRQDQSWDAASFNLVGGWQWRSEQTNHRFRIGGQFYEGPSLQWSFVGVRERLLGWGLWMDY